MYIVINKCVTAVILSNFYRHYFHNHSTSDISVFGCIGVLYFKGTSPEIWHIPPWDTLCTCLLRLLCSVRTPSHGLCPIKGQWLGPCSQVRAWNQFLSLSLCTTRTTPQYQMLVIHPALYLSSYVLPRDPQGRLTSNKTLNRTVSSKLVGNFISLYPSMPRDPVQPHCVLGRDIIQCRLALSHKWGHCFSSRRCFQSCLAVRANTNIILWPILSFSFMNAG